jgi:hypothetical protein
MSSVVDWLAAYGEQVRIALTTLFGSAAMYVFSSYKGFDNSRNFLKNILPDRAPSFYYRCDFVIMSVSGALIGLITFTPQSIYQALAAGFGWTGAMNVLLKTDPPQKKDD